MKIENATLFPMAALPLSGPKGEPLLTVMVKGTFAFRQGATDVADEQLPIAYGDTFRDEAEGGVYYESDIVPMKTRTDIVLEAEALAPKGTLAEAVPVAVRVGDLEKRMVVFGERFWNHAGVLSRNYTMTAAKPFASRPIVYEDAFGGIDEVSGAFCAENLVGKGLYGGKPKANRAGQPLPCIEDPRHLIHTIEDWPRPVGFGFYNRAWQPRAGYAGTYDQNWRKNRSPLPPEDFNPRFYNGAHPDMQTKGYLKGDEPVVLRNLTPGGEMAFPLPGIRMQCRICRRHENGRPAEQVLAMNPDTLFIETRRQRYCLVWRAFTDLEDLSADEVDHVAIGIEQG